MAITDQNKIQLAKALDHYFQMNLINQLKCQDLFGTLNRLWNELHGRIGSAEDRHDDSVKFRKFMQFALPNDDVENFAQLSCLQKLADIKPLVHNDAVVSAFQGVPFSDVQTEALPQEIRNQATAEHQEFNKYLAAVLENPNSKNKREFRNKLCRLLYVVRSNIAHGSKEHYVGSERNEAICAVVFEVLVQICNEILDGGLYRVCAYGELKRSRRLHEALVVQNGGVYIHDGRVEGQLDYSDNTLIYNPLGEYSHVDVEILEFANFGNLRRIDNVECLPRYLQPYFEGELLKGFGWVYFSALTLQDPKGPTLPWERQKLVREKTKTFLLSLKALDLRTQKKTAYASQEFAKMYGGLTLRSGQRIQYKRTGHESIFVHPSASELAALLDEISDAYRAIFDDQSDVVPFSRQFDLAINQVHFDHKALFDDTIRKSGEEPTDFIIKDAEKMVFACVSSWACKRIGDEDCELYDDLV